MRWVLNRYVRYFNRTRRPNGPLMRGRFRSIAVRERIHLRTLICYIDQNAVDAGLVAGRSTEPGENASQYRSIRTRHQSVTIVMHSCLVRYPWKTARTAS
jgi:hypothetical protein